MARKQRVDEDAGGPIGGGPGASDSNSGGGAGSGIPDAETVLRGGDAAIRGDVQKDKEKLFPETRKKQPRKNRK